MATNSANQLMKEMQKIASNAQIQVQKLANQATEKSFQYNTKEANTAREFNAKEAEKSRVWQEQMSNTAHQREVADLKKAGLNPVLSANSGAQSYTTSSASAQAASSNANDPSSSVGALAGQLMQGKIGAYQADTSAAATRQAAATSAAATRYAAAQAAQASKYAAALNYQAKMEGYKVEREGFQNAKEVAEIQNKKSLFGILTNSNVTRNIDGLKDILNKSVTKSNQVIKNKDNYLRNPDLGFKVSNLNFAGRQFVRNEVERFNIKGINNKAKAFNLYTNAFLAGNKNAIRDWNNFLKEYAASRSKSNTARRYTGITY